jgi:hypothetical protein
MPLDVRQHGFDKARGRGVEDRRGRRAQPRELTLRELPRGRDALRAKRWCIDLAVDKFPCLAVTDAAHRGQHGCERVSGPQAAKLGDEAGGEHRIESIRNRCVQLGAVGRNDGDRDDGAKAGRRIASALQCGQWCAR